jgi:hypothetical protein
MAERLSGAHPTVRRTAARAARRAAALLATGLVAALFALPGCEDKMEPEQCDKLRADAFQILNKAHHCATDADCRQSSWPGCQKPISNADHGLIKPLEDQYKQGKCEEPKIDCSAPPEAYCKQGLCVHREKGRDENAPAADEIKLE